MPRPRKTRFCRRYRADRVYKPQGVPMREIDDILISLDEFEALRHCDLEGLDQQETGEKMGISRGTVQRLLYNGREKIMRAILQNNAIVVNLKESEDSHASLHPDSRRCRGRRQGV